MSDTYVDAIDTIDRVRFVVKRPGHQAEAVMMAPSRGSVTAELGTDQFLCVLAIERATLVAEGWDPSAFYDLLCFAPGAQPSRGVVTFLRGRRDTAPIRTACVWSARDRLGNQVSIPEAVATRLIRWLAEHAPVTDTAQVLS